MIGLSALKRGSLALAGGSQDAGAEDGRYLEAGLGFQLIQHRGNVGEKTFGFGLAENAQHTDGPKPQLEGDFVDAPFFHEDGARAYLGSQGQHFGCGRVESAGGTNEVGEVGNFLLANPARKGKALEARRLADEPSEVGSHFGRDDHFAKKGGQQFGLPDATEVQQHRRVGDNDRCGKMRRRAIYFNISFTFAPSWVGGWQAVPVHR